MGVWTSQSRPALQRIAAIGIGAAGGLLVIAAGHDGPGDRRAAFWLGVLLLGLAVTAVASAGRQSVVVDPQHGIVTVTSRTMFGERHRVMALADISDIRLQRVGTASGGIVFYSLDVRLRGGGRVTLFAPGRFFPGSTNRTTVSGWRERLWADARAAQA